MAAKKLIQLLQDRQVDHENCKKEIVDLGCTYGKRYIEKLVHNNSLNFLDL